MAPLDRRRRAFTPLLGVLIGAAGGGIYWLGAQIWPTSIAVDLIDARDRTALRGRKCGHDGHGPRTPAGSGLVFAVLVKYNALMALSAANLPFAVPANFALGLIMIAGEACSRALLVSVPISAGAARRQSRLPSAISASHWPSASRRRR